VGRPFDFVYRFHDINDTIPTVEERRLVAEGKILHVSIDARDFARPAGRPITWRDVAAGRWDNYLQQQADGIASLKAPVFVTFEHEADQPRKAALGSARDFHAAWRHVHSLFKQRGADNAIWTWVVMGWEPTFQRAGTLWPGNDVVDWISWEGYNPSGCQSGAPDPNKYVTFAEAIGAFYRWLHKHAAEYRIDTAKPMMISEAGSVSYRSDPQLTAAWYAQVPETLKEFPAIKAVGLWDHLGTGAACDFRFSHQPIVLNAVANAGRHSWVNTSIETRAH
jgi:beta-mannanase